MTTLSQKNLLNLAKKNETEGNFSSAIQNCEEALRAGDSQEVILYLCDLYLKDKQEYSAYTLIKEEKDLFSNQAIFDEYSKILRANHFIIEALQVQKLSQGEWIIEVEPISETEQQQVMQQFRQKRQPTKFDYEQLFKLNLERFTTFAQSLLLDPSLNFAVRLVLCEDLARLKLKTEFTVLVLGQQEKFVPAKINLLEKDPIYREVVSGIGSRFYHRPSQLPAVLGEVNLILGSLYPVLPKYIMEPDSFASDLASYIDHHDGRANQKLFEQIDNSLPK